MVAHLAERVLTVSAALAVTVALAGAARAQLGAPDDAPIGGCLPQSNEARIIIDAAQVEGQIDSRLRIPSP